MEVKLLIPEAAATIVRLGQLWTPAVLGTLLCSYCLHWPGGKDFSRINYLKKLLEFFSFSKSVFTVWHKRLKIILLWILRLAHLAHLAKKEKGKEMNKVGWWGPPPPLSPTLPFFLLHSFRSLAALMFVWSALPPEKGNQEKRGGGKYSKGEKNLFSPPKIIRRPFPLHPRWAFLWILIRSAKNVFFGAFGIKGLFQQKFRLRSTLHSRFSWTVKYTLGLNLSSRSLPFKYLVWKTTCEPWRSEQNKNVCEKINQIASSSRSWEMQLFANGFVWKLAKWWYPLFNDMLVVQDLWGRREARSSVKVT